MSSDLFFFSFTLPYANLFWCVVLSAIIGIILASAFSAILVYAQELVPGKVGTMSGLFFGLAFGLGGLTNMVAFYEAIGVKPGDKVYRRDEVRVKIW